MFQCNDATPAAALTVRLSKHLLLALFGETPQAIPKNDS